MKAYFVSSVAVVFLSGCMVAQHHRSSVRDDEGDRMTVGQVQKEIRVGMSGAEVAEVLGSPNVVSTDEERREVWIYDKISTEKAYSSSKAGIPSLILVGLVDWVVRGAKFAGDSGAESTSQRTLTVIIKFDEEKKVRDFAYHASRF